MTQDDSELVRMLRAELAGPEPPIRAELDEIVRRGRRAIGMRRVGVAAAVFVAVASIGAGGVALRGIEEPAQPLGAASPTKAPPTSTPLVNRSVPMISVCDPWPDQDRVINSSRADVDRALSRLADVMKRGTATESTNMDIKPEYIASFLDGGFGIVRVTSTVDKSRNYIVYLQVNGYIGDPGGSFSESEAAGETCRMSNHKTLSDGTIVQSYQSSQDRFGGLLLALRVHTSQHRLYTLTVEKSGDDTVPPSMTLGELTTIGETVAKEG
ncbi:MAG: hypothetical protein JOZ47_22710 [Kutzneria sp.]|nr:hypothetical protein [Kutzneria sp.]MBV9847855.1 hypothetical protein [Kutzneria sp.]